GGVVGRNCDLECEIVRRARLFVFVFVFVRAARAGVARTLGLIAGGVEAFGGAILTIPAAAVGIIATALGKGGKIEGTETVMPKVELGHGLASRVGPRGAVAP